MPVGPESVRVGHCYATAGGQRRRVTAIVDGAVHYDVLPGGAADTSSPPAGAGSPTLEAFAAEMAQEIPCPDIPVGKPSQAEG